MLSGEGNLGRGAAKGDKQRGPDSAGSGVASVAAAGDPTLPVWVCALLPVLTIAREFSSWEVNLVLISGHRRGDYFLLKTLELPLLAALF